MINYVNESDFLNWYKSTAKDPVVKKAVLLEEVYQRYCSNNTPVFELSADETVSGQAESYRYTFDDIGCCGASTIYIYF